MFKLNQKRTYFFVLLLIIAVSVFLRVYHFSDWMHFELDQSRDAKVINLAIEQGIGNLPLLGPKAAGSFLRLGPIFYYFEYLGAKIFGNTPAGIASFNLMLSILTPPLFYLFSRRYFNRKISIMLFTLSSISLFLVIYSRFAWNPNNMPFFVLLTFYALLRAVDVAEKRKGLWLIISSASMAIATQLHFIAFLGVPLILTIFLIIKRPKINLIFWVASILIIFIFYIPPTINDFKTGGDNTKEFVKVFAKKSDEKNNTFFEKIVRNYTENAIGYFLIITGYQKSELPKFNQSNGFFEIKCDKNCKTNLPFGTAALLFFTSGIALLISVLSGLWKEKASRAKDFAIILALWSVVSFVLFTPIAYDLAPRFFLFVAPLPLLLFGFMLEFFKNKKIVLVEYVLIAVLTLSNGVMIYKRFSELNNAPRKNFRIEPDRILRERDRVTLEQQLKITEYIEGIYRQNKFPVYINSEAFYRRSFLYHLEKINIARDDFRNTGDKIYSSGNYFLIYPADNSPEEIASKYLDRYFISESVNFGTLEVIRLMPRPEMANYDKQIFGPEKKPVSAPGVPVRCRWNEIFGECNPDEPENAE